MTVQELINVLKTMPQDQQVFIRFDSDVCTEEVVSCYKERHTMDYPGDFKSWVIISERKKPRRGEQ